MGNRVVLYLRLSKEDVDKVSEGDDSASIKNQRLLLTDYALKNNFQIIKVYSDDDESGLYDDRPGFEQMIEDAKLGLFDIIIAKTQSRFSRNMEHIEKYLHHDFLNLGIRFIGVVDGVDTAVASNKKSRQINGLVNEWYCEDLSENIRSAFKIKMKNGQFLGSSCPYGYKRNPENHNHLVIDEYAANIVRRIFKLYLSGCGKARIGSILSEEGVLIPTLYKQQVRGENYKNSKILKSTRVWSYQTIHTILNNQTYVGDLVQNKTNKLSYKDKKKVSLPKEKWIVVENTHDAIISREIFRRVQEVQKIKTRSVSGNEEKGIFSGILFCADCKHSMSRKYERRGNHQFIGYICRTYKQHGKKFCSSHSIKNSELEEIVLNSIKEEAKKILTQADVDELKKFEVVESCRINYEFQLNQMENQIEKVGNYKKKTYNNFMEELIGKEEYMYYTGEYNRQIKELQLQKENLLEKMNMQNELDSRHDEWVEAFKNYIGVSELTREMVLELINRIEVHENGVIDIYYHFSNPYE
ncbi:recombinase family protein [Faecalimonas canis]